MVVLNQSDYSLVYCVSASVWDSLKKLENINTIYTLNIIRPKESTSEQILSYITLDSFRIRCYLSTVYGCIEPVSYLLSGSIFLMVL
jgi:hypothetical protein